MDILTIKFKGPTNFKGSKWIATMGGTKKHFPYGNGRGEFRKIIQEMHDLYWEGHKKQKGIYYHCGELRNQYIYTFIPEYYGCIDKILGLSPESYGVE